MQWRARPATMSPSQKSWVQRMEEFEVHGARTARLAAGIEMGTRTRSFGIGYRLKRFLMRPIFLRRKGFDWQIVLEKPQTVSHVAPASESSVPSEISEMQGQLSDLLNRHATTRSVLQHLATLERLIKRPRPPSFDRLPLDLLSGAHRQLVALAGKQPSAEIAALQSRLMLALMDRGLVNSDSELDSLRQVHIQEVSVSMFLEADHQWKAVTGGSPANPRPVSPDAGLLPSA